MFVWARNVHHLNNRSFQKRARIIFLKHTEICRQTWLQWVFYQDPTFTSCSYWTEPYGNGIEKSETVCTCSKFDVPFILIWIRNTSSILRNQSRSLWEVLLTWYQGRKLSSWNKFYLAVDKTSKVVPQILLHFVVIQLSNKFTGKRVNSELAMSVSLTW